MNNKNNQTLIIMVALVAAVMITAPAMAQFASTSNSTQTTQTGYQSYQPTVYEPFSDQTPSSSFQGADAAYGSSSESGQSKIRKGIIGVGEDEYEYADGSPIGGALLPLVLMAAAYGVSRGRRKE